VAIITYPRRSGKTLTETICAAITALSVPDGNTVAISPRKFQARDWLTACREALELLKDDEEFNFSEREYRAGEV
jgi:hypothetical protein